MNLFIQLFNIKYEKALTHYWGLMLLIGLFFFRESKGITIVHSKEMLFLFTSFFSLITFGIKKTEIKDYLICLPFMVLSFWNIWHIGSVTAIFQWLNVMAGAALFLQAKEIEITLFKKYVVLIGVIAALSILTGFFRFDIYDLMTQTRYMDINGAMTTGKTVDKQFYHGMLNGIGHTGSLVALCLSMASPLPILVGLIALGKVAALKTVTPLISLLIALQLRFADSLFKRSVSLVVSALVLVTLYHQSTSFNQMVRGEINQFKTSSRLKIWHGATKKALERPILGHGPGYFSDMMLEYQKKQKAKGEIEGHWNKMHNDFLETFFAFGIIGLLILGYVLTQALKNKDRKLKAAVIVLIIQGVLWFPIHIAIVAPIAIIVLAVSTKRHIKEGVAREK